MEEGDKGKPRVLIVDDEAAIRMVLMAGLRRSGEYELYEASDGSAAKAILQQRPFDVVVTDLVMPGLDGLSLLRWAQQNCPGPAWIILSGRATFDDAVEAVRLGAFDFITKPLAVLDKLVVSVRNAIRQQELIAGQRRLQEELEDSNQLLNKQVVHLKEACRMLCDQAETIGEDLRRAELIQRALLPRQAPETPGLGIDSMYRPSQKVGGDLYDAVKIGPRHLVFYVADAAGNGVSAAMLAVLFKHRLHLINEQTGEPTAPAEVLDRVNRALKAECSGPGLFITAAFGVLDLESRELTIASAGHTPLLLHRAEGKMEMIFPSGPALGMRDQANFAQSRTVLNEGDRLLLYTDGLLDSGGPKTLLTRDKLIETLGDKNLAAQRLLRALLDMSIYREGHGKQEDDITMLLLTVGQQTSTLDNGEPAAARASAPPATPEPADSEVLIGSTDVYTGVCIRGRGIWSTCPSFHDVCLAELKAHHPLTLDFSGCEYLDSTFLGTIQEVVDEATDEHVDVRIQGTKPEVKCLFEQLGMEGVVAHFTPDMTPMPTKMQPLEAVGNGDQEFRQRILHAHETLASLSERNRQEFGKLIDGLRNELDKHETTH